RHFRRDCPVSQVHNQSPSWRVNLASLPHAEPLRNADCGWRRMLKSTYSAIRTSISHFGMSSLSYRKLRAPDGDGAALIDPPLADVPAMIAANRAAAIDRDLRLGLRRGFCADARQRMLPAGAARGADSAPPVIMTGHDR